MGLNLVTSTDYGYDVRGRAASLADRGPGGAAPWQVQYGTDASGRRTSAQESGPGWFRTLSYRYDPLGRLVQETLTDGAPSGRRVSPWGYHAHHALQGSSEYLWALGL
ncbi:MAG: hypothetical protein KBG48_33075 [Kofleriaceae bacterium]|nr:hypothetical protein [Kofleriaceae bacterium]MBP9172243.1 hypothetical protein [Kofleriaceae bacterium]MBP9861074.1 hypothetical protein [Kofleriaceae bacterium]